MKNFIELTRAYSIPTVIASCLIVFSYAYYSEKFSFMNFIILTIALCCVNLGENLYDDLLDIHGQLKQGIKLDDIKFSSYIPKARLIINKTCSLPKAWCITLLLFLIAVASGIYFIVQSGTGVLFFALIGAILVLLYPVASKYYLAELIVALIYGPLIIMGGFYTLTGEFNLNLLLLSFAILFSTIILLHIHSLMDWEFDVKDGKKTLCTLSGSKENALKIGKYIIVTAYTIIVIGVMNYNFNPKMLLVFLTLPIATELIKSMNDYINVNNVQFRPKWYLGIFENWNTIQLNKIDFFMYRFYLARNFSLLFALFATIGAMI